MRVLQMEKGAESQGAAEGVGSMGSLWKQNNSLWLIASKEISFNNLKEQEMDFPL